MEALSKHARASEMPDDDIMFFVFDKWFDRTVYFELADPIEGESVDFVWPKLATKAVREVQNMLRTQHPYWRVLVPGDEDENEAFFIYPDGLVFSPEAQGETDRARLLWTANQRKKRFERREGNRQRRLSELKALLQKVDFDTLAKTPTLLAWFDTASEPYEDFGWEGDPGTSVWLLFPNTDNQRPAVEYIDCTEFRRTWFRADRAGKIVLDDKGNRPDRYWLLHLASESNLTDNIAIAFGSKRMKFTRSSAMNFA